MGRLGTGYTIPAGWMVVVASSVIHYDHTIYENPFEFNPWRWEVYTDSSLCKAFFHPNYIGRF